MAGWTSPARFVARDVTLCSPGVAAGQATDQNFQAKSDPSPTLIVAGIHGPLSTPTSIPAIGAPPCCAHDPMRAICSRHAGRRRLEKRLADRGFGPHRLPVALLLADGHIVACHEVAHEPRIEHPDTVQPLHVATPYQPGASSRTGAPCSAGSDSPFIS